MVGARHCIPLFLAEQEARSSLRAALHEAMGAVWKEGQAEEKIWVEKKQHSACPGEVRAEVSGRD